MTSGINQNWEHIVKSKMFTVQNHMWLCPCTDPEDPYPCWGSILSRRRRDSVLYVISVLMRMNSTFCFIVQCMTNPESFYLRRCKTRDLICFGLEMRLSSNGSSERRFSLLLVLQRELGNQEITNYLYDFDLGCTRICFVGSVFCWHYQLTLTVVLCLVSPFRLGTFYGVWHINKINLNLK